MFAIVIILSIILTFIFSLFGLLVYFLDAVSKKIIGGYVTPSQISISRNRLFYLKEDYKQALNKIINKNFSAIKYFDEIPNSLKYIVFSDVARTSMHIGQLKLFLTEIEFLTDCLQNYDEKAIVIYAGSAPGNHTHYLSKMFPNVKFILVDPEEHLIFFEDDNHYLSSAGSKQVVYLNGTSPKNKFGIKERIINLYQGNVIQIPKEKILQNNEFFTKLLITENLKNDLIKFINDSSYKYFIIEDYFTSDLAHLFKNVKHYFISDIRSNINGMIDLMEKINHVQIKRPSVESSDEFPSDLDIYWNSAQQLIWLNIMNSLKCMLKFRVPFLNQKKEEFQYYAALEPFKSTFEEAKKYKIDFIKDYENKEFKYIKNENIYIQAYPGISSTESRLIASKYDRYQNYITTDYDDKFYYYNKFYRLYAFHNHPYLDRILGLDGCSDCAMMVKLFQDYYEKYDLKDNSKKDIINLLRTIHRNLRENPLHGIFLKPYKNIQEILNQQKTFILYSSYTKYKDELISQVDI